MSGAVSSELSAAVQGWLLAAAAAGERGPVRRENQDAFRLVSLAGGGLGLILADGMGGQAGGGAAAAAAVTAAATAIAGPGGATTSLEEVIEAANGAVADVRRHLGGSPGTTLVAAAVTAGRLSLAHVGDSRAYLLRAGTAIPLTSDHSLTAEQVREGSLSPEQARSDPRRNYLTRALLGDPVVPDLTATELRHGDAVLLCTDGLWGALPDPRIAEVAGDGAPLGAARELVTAAISAGSTDNVTAVLVRLSQEGPVPT